MPESGATARPHAARQQQVIYDDSFCSNFFFRREVSSAYNSKLVRKFSESFGVLNFSERSMEESSAPGVAYKSFRFQVKLAKESPAGVLVYVAEGHVRIPHQRPRHSLNFFDQFKYAISKFAIVHH